MMSHFVVAQAVAPGQSALGWMVSSLSYSSALALLIGVMLFAGACYLIATGTHATVIAAYLVLLPLPLLVSLCGELKGMVASLTVMAASPEIQVTSADLAGGFATSLFSVLAALLVSAPTYIVLAAGLLIRTAQTTKTSLPSQAVAL